MLSKKYFFLCYWGLDLPGSAATYSRCKTFTMLFTAVERKNIKKASREIKKIKHNGPHFFMINNQKDWTLFIRLHKHRGPFAWVNAKRPIHWKQKGCFMLPVLLKDEYTLNENVQFFVTNKIHSVCFSAKFCSYVSGII